MRKKKLTQENVMSDWVYQKCQEVEPYKNRNDEYDKS